MQYPMLLNALIHRTPEEHVDYQNLQKAIQAMNDAATLLNETKRGVENIAQIHTIISNLRGLPLNIAHPARKLIKSGLMFRETSSRAHEERMFYLFNDMLLSVKQSDLNKDEGFYDGYVLLRGAEVNLTPSVPGSFYLKLKNATKLFYHLPSKELCTEWFTAVYNAADLITKSPKDTSPDLLLDVEHFGGGNTSKSGKLTVFEPEHKLSIRKNRRRYVVVLPGLLIVKKDASVHFFLLCFSLFNFFIILYCCLFFSRLVR
jgi:hypothetical protein